MKAGLGFQLNADVTARFVGRVFAFSVTLIPKRNNTMCLCVIPNSKEIEQAYTRNYVFIVPSIKHCGKADCVPCSLISEFLADAEVRKYIDSQKFNDCKLPVETAMCDKTFSRAGAILEKA
jgi:hypothetical protein